jgi:hypothetical protein
MTSSQEAFPPSGSGSLCWGIKHSFLRYLGSLPDGQCSVTDGASAVTGGASPAPGPLFVFTAAGDKPHSPPDGPTVLRYRGDVRFKGHFGFLRVRVADPWLEIAGDEGKLSALGIGGDPVPRRPLVTFRVRRAEGGPEGDGTEEDGPEENGPEENGTVFRGTDVRLTVEGSELFGDHYPAGEPFDDFAFEMPR